MRFPLRPPLHAMVCALLCLPALAMADAATYPSRPVKIIVSFPPGTGSDGSARFLAQKLEARLGQPFVVENRPGANSFIAAQTVARAEPDGYTLFVASNSPMATNVAQFKSLPYDPVKDFAPVARLYYGAMVLSVPASSPYRTVRDLVEAAKANPGKLSYGSGSASYQIATELFLRQAGAKAVAIPYKGAAPAMADLAGGQVDFAMSDYTAAAGLAQAGKTRILAVAGDKRLSVQPNVPTLQEVGFKDYYMVNWVSLFAPAKTPADIVAKLGKAAVEIFNSKDAEEFIGRTNGQIFAGGPEVLRKFQLDEIKRWSAAATLAGIPKQ
ncbi:tripartite-type tricarboxylate transporter receptor subunit TctC [Cupriavidus gilardii J11]|uniref:Tripartite-type tricarboxylate transporter receptor subunit TctC n=1 Tax=Cupriavidus gilardii J11 TaxID=936133 RepID=A0A562BKB0_9BURK|nr:tripartite-type tricarboxylate transporter receptor subunit TctC [Cupriavidus gilardii J11]